MDLSAVAAVLMGISLAACAGLRAFMPLFFVGLAARMHWIPVQSWFEWAGSTEALITFGVATLLELLADKVPVLDHFLDVFHTFARPVAGALVAMTAFHQLSPTYATALGIIVGAPIAGAFHLTKAGTRVASTHLTAGIANPVLSVLEDVAAFFGAVMALVAPIVAFLTFVALGVLGVRYLRSRKRAAAGPHRMPAAVP